MTPQERIPAVTDRHQVATARNSNMSTGQTGEDLACRYLMRHGYRILARNWRSRTGEIDIVALEDDTVVAVEVKTRRGYDYGTPLESISRSKVMRIRRLVGEWFVANRMGVRRCRIDAIGIVLLRGSEPRIVHIQGVS